MANIAAQSNSPRKTAWKRYIFNCGYPITATKLSLVSFLLTIVAKKLILIDLLADYTYLVTWAAIAVCVYIADIVLRAICMSSDWYNDNPVQDWKYRPRTTQGYLSSLLGLLLLMVVGFSIITYYDFDFKVCNYLPEVFPFTLYCKSDTLDNSHNNSGALSEISKRISRNDDAIATNKWAIETLSKAIEELRQDQMKLLSGPEDISGTFPQEKGLGIPAQESCSSCDQGGNVAPVDNVEEPIVVNPNQKCWDRYPQPFPVTCNVLQPCMHGRHPITGITQQDCISAP